MSYEENFQKTAEIVKLANQTGASVEGELVTVGGVEDGIGNDEEGALLPVEKAIEFMRETGIYCYAPPSAQPTASIIRNRSFATIACSSWLRQLTCRWFCMAAAVSPSMCSNA